MRLSKQSEISLWIGTPAVSKCMRWWSALTSCFRSRQPPMQEKSIPESMRPTSTEVTQTVPCSLLPAVGEKHDLAMVGLQGLHLSNALKCPHISAGMVFKLFCPWCLKLGRNTDNCHPPLQSALPDGHCVWHLPAWPCKAFKTYSLNVRGSMTKSTWSSMPK